MLAFPALSPPLPFDLLRTPPPSMCSNTVSLAILASSPITYGPASLPHLSPPTPSPSSSASPSPSKRPKLTLNTTGAAILPSPFGKSSTSLRLETLSSTSPTSRNTFRNGYHVPQSIASPSTRPHRPALTPLTTDVPPVASRTPTPIRADLSSSAESSDFTSSSAVSATSISTIESLPIEPPYHIPTNIKSILNNGPVARRRSKRLPFSQSEPMFPTTKHVAFRAPLTEEIRTTKYTLAHSDISSSSISTLELPPPAHGKEEGEVHREAQSEKSRLEAEGGGPAGSPTQVGGKRDSSSDDENESDSCPATPVAGRRKRHRQWRWTLGPVGGSAEGGTQPEKRWDEPPETVDENIGGT